VLKFEVKPYGENAIYLEFGDEITEKNHLHIRNIYQQLRSCAAVGIVAVIPSYCGLTIIFEPKKISKYEVVSVCYEFSNIKTSQHYFYKRITVPVCYNDVFALDKHEVLEELNLSWSKIIEIHKSSEYLVYMLGFVPGFLYLGGMDCRIKVPRKKTPRLRVPKGSVAIGGIQTGIYPIEIPGGWSIIGRTPINLLCEEVGDRIEMGDRVNFVPISLKEFSSFKGTFKRELIEY
jgi:KipI family sensor histidine kinase inhibitor